MCTPKLFLLFLFATALSASATTASMNGTTFDSLLRTGLVGVTVSLAKGGLTTTSGAGGAWSLSGSVPTPTPTTGIAARQGTSASQTHLSIRDGHPLLSYEGHGLLGKVQPSGAVASQPSASLARSAAVAADTIDTLLFSWKGTVKVRVPITSYLTKYLSTIVDTLSPCYVATGDSGTFIDGRDGQSYKYVRIGTQTWMAQNLNYRNTTGSTDTVGACYGNSTDSCAKYGRLYYWDMAMAGANFSTSKPSHVQGICPTGWHMPSDSEWSALFSSVGGDSARVRLSATSGWKYSTVEKLGNGTDLYGFSALPGGISDLGTYSGVGKVAYFWSTTKFSSAGNPFCWIFSSGSPTVSADNVSTSLHAYSLRCLQ